MRVGKQRRQWRADRSDGQGDRQYSRQRAGEASGPRKQCYEPGRRREGIGEAHIEAIGRDDRAVDEYRVTPERERDKPVRRGHRPLRDSGSAGREPVPFEHGSGKVRGRDQKVE